MSLDLKFTVHRDYKNNIHTRTPCCDVVDGLMEQIKILEKRLEEMKRGE